MYNYVLTFVTTIFAIFFIFLQTVLLYIQLLQKEKKEKKRFIAFTNQCFLHIYFNLFKVVKNMQKLIFLYIHFHKYI